ncbi:hypothetical protein CANCADRAFT_86916 [Tortispora caseinolytica NRRL Y-17796]|uniref:Orotidine 5'-phosphate decarboxylase n=1 Tax=Tortispora caseinolytica NRRL Y-17796 TaxID=767744 RepID=A0A1E4TLC4_9ASCO|nr:hypothetical protein CANCADRAFT_86916 [Tortispora caseinolytica NRRL Y-17796]
MRTFKERAETAKSAVMAQLFNLMSEKKTNLCVSADVTTTKELLELADKVGPYICVLKTHIDIVDDFEYTRTVEPLVALAEKHRFLLFEDRKFADIGSTVKAQFTAGIYRIAQWANITNAHTVPGPGVVSGLRSGNQKSGLLLLAEMSTAGALTTPDYAQKTLEIARQNADFVVGFIAQHAMGTPDEDWVIMTPGVGLDDKGDGLGQQYRTVSEVMASGSDIIIVGRGISGKGRDPVVEAQRYREAGWNAYKDRVDGKDY